jgi:eukaryotic-like serine/threonine-protein kinase
MNSVELIANRYQHDGNRLRGGMGAVLICQDTVLERKVAIKIMPGYHNKRRVLDEVRALLKMRSKHVVQVYDVLSFANGELGIVQEFIDGKDLFEASVLPKNAEQFLKTVWQIACGIEEIHEVNVIHRDIKPNNMKFDPEGVIKIFDFGLARDQGTDAATVGFIGTPGFAAPELYSTNPKFEKAVDIYAFGITALFLATGTLPAELKMQPQKFISGNYFANTNFALTEDIQKILNDCLAQEPSKRPAMSRVKKILAQNLLRDRHRALVVHQKEALYLHKDKKNVRLIQKGVGEIEISYDGLRFCATNVAGDVFLNNQKVEIGKELPGACVVALGAADLGNQRKYITFDLSHPEIVL